MHESVGLVQFVVFVVRDGCKAKEILSNHGKMHKALYGRIKDELQLNIMEIGPSGLHFGLFFIRVINKIGRLTVLDKKMKIRDSSSSNKWLSSVLLLSTQEAARAIWGLWENLFWLARAIYGLWKNLQVFIYSKLHKKKWSDFV